MKKETKIFVGKLISVFGAIAAVLTIVGTIWSAAPPVYRCLTKSDVVEFSAKNPELMAFVIRDSFVFVALLCVVLTLFLVLLALFKKLGNDKIKRENCRDGLVKCSHRLIHEIKESLYRELPESREDKLNFIEISAQQLLDSVKQAVSHDLESRGARTVDEISTTLKFIHTGEEILNAKGVDAFDVGKRVVEKEKKYVVTFARDSATKGKTPPREIKKRVYSYHANTAFTVLDNPKTSHFTDNDLKSNKGKSHAHHNENPEWEDFYNSAQAVPIRVINSKGDYFIIGYVTVDSLNEFKEELFDEGTAEILSQATDLFAIVFYLLYPEANGGKVSTDRRNNES